MMLSFPESQIDRGGKCTKLPPSAARFRLHFNRPGLIPRTPLSHRRQPAANPIPVLPGHRKKNNFCT